VKVLIIGATGRTGRILLEKALEQGHQVTALARLRSSEAGLCIEPPPRGEIRPSEGLRAA
jgi:putative NADH-flavin reductase